MQVVMDQEAMVVMQAQIQAVEAAVVILLEAMQGMAAQGLLS
jgi:hypothetical protein